MILIVTPIERTGGRVLMGLCRQPCLPLRMDRVLRDQIVRRQYAQSFNNGLAYQNTVKRVSVKIRQFGQVQSCLFIEQKAVYVMLLPFLGKIFLRGFRK